MEIGGLQKTTLIDYPGHVACTVFTIGCNFRCPWCYSAELVLPEKIKNQPRIEEKDFFNFLDQRKGSLDGVVICGGEPTINQDLPRFVSKIKEKGFKVKLDTNGSNPEMLKELIKSGELDYIAMDIKAPLVDEKYQESTGREIEVSLIKESIEIIKNSGIDYEFRTTVVSGIHEKEDILEIAKKIGPAKRYFLQKFRAEKNIDSSLVDQRPHSDESLEEIRKEISHLFDVCQVRH